MFGWDYLEKERRNYCDFLFSFCKLGSVCVLFVLFNFCFIVVRKGYLGISRVGILYEVILFERCRRF